MGMEREPLPMPRTSQKLSFGDVWIKDMRAEGWPMKNSG
jgi:hypothetical protein